MGLMSFFRNKAFWAMDFVKGSHVRKAYIDIKTIDETDSDDPFIQAYQKQAWMKLKENACLKTKAYAPYVHCEFEQFPMINKQDIRRLQDDYLSSDYRKDELIKMSTSGSTGTPFVCYQNGLKKRRVNAEVIYYSEKVGYRLGENLSYIRTVVKQIQKSGLKQYMQNQTMIQCGKLSDAGCQAMIDAIEKQSKKGPVTLLAYGSTYTALKNYCLKHRITPHCNVVGAISGSDMLFDETRDAVSKVLGGIPVVSRYSNEENGVLGQDEGMNNVFALNEADYIVEILDEKGNCLPDGNVGRIVVTDLYNYAMPMIRYDTGDMGAIKSFYINGRKKRCICDFSGRRVDVIFDAEGNALSPYAITNAMWEFTDVTQFQIIQTAQRKYICRLNADKTFNREKDLLHVLHQVLGQSAQIELERVEEIPVLASGKRRYIVNDWNQ